MSDLQGEIGENGTCHKIMKIHSKNIKSIVNWTDLERKSKYRVKIAGFKNIRTKIAKSYNYKDHFYNLS